MRQSDTTTVTTKPITLCFGKIDTTLLGHQAKRPEHEAILFKKMLLFW
jgi:hypothetical protein